MGRETWRNGDPHEQNCAVYGDNLAKINTIYNFYAPGQLEYSSIDKMAKYDWNSSRNYVAFIAGEFEGQGAHITTVWVDFVLSWSVSAMRSQS